MASKAELSEHNARVRRLARAYAPKYRPIIFSLGYHIDLDEGLSRTYVKVKTIVAESARYTASGKPLQERYVKRLLSELEKAGAVKSEPRYREDTGRQTSSWRTLVTTVSVDRYGFPRNHDFWAEFPQVSEKKDTPQDTPEDTPQDTRTVLDLPGNCPGTTSSSRAGDEDDQEPQEDQNQSGELSQDDGCSHPCPQHHIGSKPQDGCEGCIQEVTYDLVEYWEHLNLQHRLVEKLVRRHSVTPVIRAAIDSEDYVAAKLEARRPSNPAGYFMTLLENAVMALGEDVQ